MSERVAQCERILRLLRSYEGRWVPLPELLSLGCASHTRRIFELRKTHNIEMKEEWVGQSRHTSYRLIPENLSIANAEKDEETSVTT
jgi:hypothetical protein